MTILFVGPDPSGRGGAARSLRRLTRSLQSVGHRVCICHPDETLFPDEVIQDGRRRRFGGDRSLPRWVDEVLAAAAHTSPDLVVGWYASAGGFCAVTAAKLLGLPVVVCLRGNDVDRDFLTPDRHAIVRYTMAQADALTAVSTEMADKVAAWVGRRPVFIANGVDRTVFFPDPAAGAVFHRAQGLSSDAPVLGMFGEFKPKRGLDRLRRWGGMGWQILLVGHVRPSVARSVPSDACVVPTITDDDVLRGAYNACDVVIQPSVHDGMPNVVLEAMACGRAVVGSAVGGMRDAIVDGQTGRLCVTDAEWRAALLDVSSKAVAAALGAAAVHGPSTLEEERRAFERVCVRVRRGVRERGG
ncbi:MAG: glycosyltransferase family 4 protein [Myxococcota bacterium]